MTSFLRRAGSRAALMLLAGWFAATMPMSAAAQAAELVLDARTGEVLHERNADERLHPASLTKMMTLYIAFEAVRNGEIGLDDKVAISVKAANEVPSKLGLRAGQEIELRYLISAAALRSANDAATAISEAIAGDERSFAQRMTRTARAIGMSRTSFRNAHGLTHPEQLSTARDMAILARQLYFDFPEYYEIFSRYTDDAGVAQVNNTNGRLLSTYRGADGIKTGFTRAAGYNLVGAAERDGIRIIAAIMGSASVAQRTSRMHQLLDTGFKGATVLEAELAPAPPAYVQVVRSPLPRSRSTAMAEAGLGRAAVSTSGTLTRDRSPMQAGVQIQAAPTWSLELDSMRASGMAAVHDAPYVNRMD